MSESSVRRGGGIKRDSGQTFHRRLFLVRRLVRGPADAATLIADARDFFNVLDIDDIYPADARAALRNDFRALRDEFGCCISLGEGRRYQLDDLGRLALLDLPDSDLEALAFLIANFSQSSLPNADQVDAVLDRIIALLPPDRRKLLDRQTRDVRLDHPQPSGEAIAGPLKKIKRALGRQEITFAYRSSFAQGDTVVQHRVAPYHLIFRDGHTYLDAYCIDCGVSDIERRYWFYRVDRIVPDSLRQLPNRLPPVEPPRPRYQLDYTLGPLVARQRDIALWFNNSEVTFYEDGSARIRAETGDLWQARQILLRYREHCRIHAPEELIAMMHESVLRMYVLYSNEESA